MTQRNRIHFWAVGHLGALLLRGFNATWHFELIDPAGGNDAWRTGRVPGLLAFWHRHILSLAMFCRGVPACVPISRSADGEIIAQVARRLGYVPARGSSSRGGAHALRALMARAREGHPCAVTLDGPRGPVYHVHPGFAVMARRLELAVFPVGVAVGRAWVARSWDRFVVPKPFAEIAVCWGEPLRYGRFGDAEAMCAGLREAMFAATRRAQEYIGPDAVPMVPTPPA
jgi:lysophospholipid acyltransferase (LPLAT)-like uncharacterized protein